MNDFDRPAPPAALTGSLRDFQVPAGPDLLARLDGFRRWREARADAGLWPYARALENGPRTVVAATEADGAPIEAVNFLSQDALSLSYHPAIREAAIEALRRYGPHAAGASTGAGATPLSRDLEATVAGFLGMQDALLYPSGWAAGYGLIRALVRSADHVVIDSLAHSALQDGALAATRNVAHFRHHDVEHCRRLLTQIRARDAENGVLIVAESLNAAQSDFADIAGLQALAREFGATLALDVSQDLGCMGVDGRGALGAQAMAGEVDIVVGSFSKSFAANGGFVAMREGAIKEYLRFYGPTQAFSSALSPAQTAAALKAFEIVGADEGRHLRARLAANVGALRAALGDCGYACVGEPTPIVQAVVGGEAQGRLIARRLPGLGLLARLVEYPAAPKGESRIRLQAMAGHNAENIAAAVAVLERAKAETGAPMRTPAPRAAA